MKNLLSTGLLILIVAISYVHSADNGLTDEELTALNRDGFSRVNPDSDFTRGNFAAWPVGLFLIAATCLVISIIGFLGYAVGICRKPKHEFQTIVA